MKYSDRNDKWLQKYRLKIDIAIGIAIAIDCGARRGKHDSDPDSDFFPVNRFCRE